MKSLNYNFHNTLAEVSFTAFVGEVIIEPAVGPTIVVKEVFVVTNNITELITPLPVKPKEITPLQWLYLLFCD